MIASCRRQSPSQDIGLRQVMRWRNDDAAQAIQVVALGLKPKHRNLRPKIWLSTPHGCWFCQALDL
jgi:hypothetical protein